MSTEKELVLVTGAAGLVGRRLTAMLLQRGYRVRTLDLQPLPLAGTEHLQGDLRDEGLIKQALDGVEVVFHTASYISLDPREDAAMHEINVVATQQLIKEARRMGVNKLIYTSSIDVVYEGKPIRRGDEELPYPKKFMDYYAYSKAAAEQAVLNAHNPLALCTVSLRPAGIYGPGDRVRLPALLEEVRKGRWVVIGDGQAEFNHVYVDNVAHAHILAAERLMPDSEIGGQAYFITDHAPSFFFDFFKPIIEGLGYRPKVKKLPYGFAMGLAKFLTWWDVLPWNKHREAPKLTPYVVASTARDFSFVHDRAADELEYRPIVSQKEAIKATIRDLRERGFAAHSTHQR